MAGKCAPFCASGKTNCSGTCVDLQKDVANCGGCGAACKAGETCAVGKCGVPASCAKVLAANPAAKSGMYNIRPLFGGNTLKVHCDMTTAGGGWTRVFRIKLGANLGCTMTHAQKGDPASASATCAKYSDTVINTLAASKIFFSRVGSATPLFTRYSTKIRIDGPPGKVVQSLNYNDVASATPSYTPQYTAWVFFSQQNWYNTDRCFGAQLSSYRLSLEYLGGKHSCGKCLKYACTGACNKDCPTHIKTGIAEVYVR